MIYVKIPLRFVVNEAGKQSALSDIQNGRIPGWAVSASDIAHIEFISDVPPENKGTLDEIAYDFIVRRIDDQHFQYMVSNPEFSMILWSGDVKDAFRFRKFKDAENLVLSMKRRGMLNIVVETVPA